MLDLLAPGAGDAAWHGACLALAELARRGALLPARLPAAAPLVAAALHFDARRGAHRRARRPQAALSMVCRPWLPLWVHAFQCSSGCV